MCQTTRHRRVKRKNRVLRYLECLTALHDMMGQEDQLCLQKCSPKPPNSLSQYHANLKEILPILKQLGEYRDTTVAGFTHSGILQF